MHTYICNYILYNCACYVLLTKFLATKLDGRIFNATSAVAIRQPLNILLKEINGENYNGINKTGKGGRHNMKNSALHFNGSFLISIYSYF
jgi:hypothetical protein